MSDDDMSEYDDDWDDDDNSIWQDMTNETVHIDERKASTNSTSSITFANSASSTISVDSTSSTNSTS